MAIMHKNKLVHNDIKLENILLFENEYVLIDFDHTTPDGIDLKEHHLGTPGFTLSTGKSNPYHDFLNFGSLLQ